MKLKRLLFPLFACIAAGVFFLQCTRCTPLTDTQFKEPITLVTYNTQTFFDAVEDGTEFKEYKGSNPDGPIKSIGHVSNGLKVPCSRQEKS